MAMEPAVWQTLSEAYAFLGNSLLVPLSQTEKVGLAPEFWRAFPTCESDEVEKAVEACVSYAEGAQRRAEEGADVVQDVSYEFTRLFVGPPTPAAAPWETMYRSKTNVGFGEPTFQMRELLREAGLELSSENNQYEDHMGIELLYLSELCRRHAAFLRELDCAEEEGAAKASAIESAGSAGESGDAEEGAAARAAQPGINALSETAIARFIVEHPLGWVGELRTSVSKAFPEGYYAALLGVAQALLQWQADR